MENNQTSNAILVGLNTLSNEDTKVSSLDIEALANFKGILRAILNGQLALVSPDRVLPEGVELPKKENKTPNKEE